MIHVMIREAFDCWFSRWLIEQGVEGAVVLVPVLFEPFDRGPCQVGRGSRTSGWHRQLILVVVDGALWVSVEAAPVCAAKSYTHSTGWERPMMLLLPDAPHSMGVPVYYPHIGGS